MAVLTRFRYFSTRVLRVTGRATERSMQLGGVHMQPSAEAPLLAVDLARDRHCDFELQERRFREVTERSRVGFRGMTETVRC